MAKINLLKKILILFVRIPKKVVFIVFLALKLGASFIDKIKMVSSGLLIYLNDNKKTDKLYSVKIKILGNKHKINIENFSDLNTLNEIYIDEIYNTISDLKPSVIFDLGSNIGFSCLYFHFKYPDSKIFCFEPDPDNYRILLSNTKNINGIVTKNIAVSSENKYIDFYQNINSGVSSSIKFINGKNQNKIRIQSQTLDAILNEYNLKLIDILKIDVEGAEYDILSGTDILKNVKMILGELHPIINNISIDKFIKIFNEYGFKISLNEYKSKEHINFIAVKNS